MKKVRKSFQIFKSSAGSGKTFTLVREYLAVALRQPEMFRSVLAITFTNKAAGEMKERIIGELKLLAREEDSAMREALIEMTGLEENQLRINAQEVLSRILHQYALFAVSTIDSFTYKLIRNFAKDLDLPSKFDVETDTSALLERMVDQLMDAIGRDPFITQILVHFAEEKLRDEAGWHIDKDIGDVARELFKEGSKAPIDGLNKMDPDKFMNFIEFIRDEKDRYPREFAEMGAKGQKIIEDAHLAPADFFGGARSSCVSIFWKIQKKCSPAEYQKLVEKGRFATAVADDKWYSKKDKAGFIEGVLNAGLRDLAQELVAYHEAHFDHFLTLFHAYQNIHSLAVLRQIEELLDVYKMQHNLVHISDFQDKISDFIQGEAPDYIYWRLGERYRHYLLDEFQDTSFLQWVNLYPLFDYVRTDTDRDGSLLLVGDSKQAIYRWRGGEVDLMEVVAPAKLEVEPQVLGRNFRSKEFVVDFNNRFFAQVREILHANPLVRQIYTDFEQDVRPGNEGSGLVQVIRMEASKMDEYKQEALERLAGQIREMQGQGFQLRDMAVLTRSGKDGSEIARYLSDEGIRVISSESILLYKSPAIGFMVSLFKFLVDARDRIAQAEVLHYFYIYLPSQTVTEEDLFSEVSQPYDQMRELLEGEKTITGIFEVLPPEFKNLSYQLDRLPLYELTEEIIRIFKLNLVAPAYLQHFLDIVLQYGERKKPDLAGFLDFWEDKKGGFSLVVPEGENAVEILTVHKSKGLEFPVVFVPFTEFDIQPRPFHSFWATAEEGFGEYPDTYLIHPRKELTESHFREDYEGEINKTLLDNINLLYVAFTRPRERLYIYAKQWNRRAKAPPTIKDIRTAGQLIHMVLETDGFEGLDDLHYETGFPLPPSSESSEAESAVAGDFLSEPWRDRIRIDRRYRKFWEGNPSDGKGEISDGTVMAEVLRRMTESDELLLLMNDLQEEGLIDEKRRWGLEDRIDGLLQRDPLKKWYSDSKNVKRGASILSPSGNQYTPDRLMVEGKTATLIDFLDKDRGIQLEDSTAYRSALLEMGYKEVKAFACYLPIGNVEELKISG